MPQDSNHIPSSQWMRRYTDAGGLLVSPALLLIEVSAGVKRRTGQPVVAKQAANELLRVSELRVIPIDSALVQGSVDVAADLSLKAGDAVYVALAEALGIPLVSWDKQQLQRASGLVAAFTPDSFLF